MVIPVSKHIKTIIFKITLFLLAGMPIPSVWAGMVDPTRPPNTVDQEVSNAGPVLQSILIGPARSEAIISGRTVKLGDQFGEARVMKITESEVVLKSGNEIQTLKLFPSIEKRLTDRQASVTPASRGQEK